MKGQIHTDLVNQMSGAVITTGTFRQSVTKEPPERNKNLQYTSLALIWHFIETKHAEEHSELKLDIVYYRREETSQNSCRTSNCQGEFFKTVPRSFHKLWVSVWSSVNHATVMSSFEITLHISAVFGSQRKRPTKSLEELAIIVEVLEEDLKTGNTYCSPLQSLPSPGSSVSPEWSPTGKSPDCIYFHRVQRKGGWRVSTFHLKKK